MTKTAKSTQKLLLISFTVFIIIGSIMLIGGWYYIFAVSSSVNKINSEVVNLQEESEVLSDLNIKYAYVSNKNDLVLEALPNNKEVSSFLATIEQIAKNNNLSIQEDNIGETSTKKKITDVNLRQTVGKENYYKLRNEYNLKDGKYENILNFIKDVSNLRRVAQIESVKLVATGNPTEEGGAVLSAKVVINIFVKK